MAHKRAGKGQWTYHDSLYKGPTPRGIYIPRLLSIIRHLPFSPLTSSPRLPGPAAGKSWLVSWWLDRERSRQGYRDGVWEVERIGGRNIKVEKIIRKMYFCLCPSASGFLTVPVIWQQSDFTAQCCLLLFFFLFFASLIVHVAPQIRLAVRSGECQHHLSPLLSRTVPEGSTSVRNPLMCSALAYQSVQDVKQLVRGRLSYRNRRWSRNV